MGSSSLIHPESLSKQGVTAVITEALAGLAIAEVLEARLTDAPGRQGVIWTFLTTFTFWAKIWEYSSLKKKKIPGVCKLLDFKEVGNINIQD